MNKTTIQMAFDAEKLGAIRQYMEKKDADLNAELDDFMQKLYEKYVPAAVREYIETRPETAEPKPQRPPRPRTVRNKNESPAGGKPDLPVRPNTPPADPYNNPARNE